MPTELLGLSRDELRARAEDWGEPAFRGQQLYHALYVERRFAFSAMTNLPLALRERMAAEASITLPKSEKRFVSADGSVRYLLRLADGRSIETVWMPEVERQTLCISSQAGCAVDCHFCATAQLGLLRNLTAGEIVGQVLVVLDAHREELRPNTNVVLMGQGEPLLNYDATLAAVRLLADADGMAIPLKKITLSTSGIVPGIRRLAEEQVRPKLAVSLNATTDEQRAAVMPINRKYQLAELLAACRDYPLRPWERLTFEYVLLGGLNDAAEDARRLARLLAGLRAKVNLIPWNAVPSLPYRSPEESVIAEFQRLLREAGVLVFIRRSRGQDVFAACGQLAVLELPTVVQPLNR